MAYSYYRALTIDKTKVPNTNRTDFPVLVSGTYSWLATVANGGKVRHASGYDVAFYSDAALTTQLKHEVERWIATTGEVIYYVKVPTVSTSVDTVIYIAYGDASISTDQSDKVNVWDTNFKGVWHLPNGTTLAALDSTSNANNGTITGAVAAAGKLAGGASFDGIDDIVDVGSGVSMDNLTTFTISAWVNPDAVSANEYLICGKFVNPPGIDFGVGAWYGGGSGDVYCWVGRATTKMEVASADGTVTIGAWQYLVTTWTGVGATAKLYRNGSEVSYRVSVIGSGAQGDESAVVRTIGARAGATNLFDGVIDEVRVSNVVRSTDWILTDYNNQNSPSTFYSVGSEAVTSVGSDDKTTRGVGRGIFRGVA